MIHLRYQLNQENFKELNSYLAVHDRKMQKKLMAILCSLIVFVILLGYILFRLSGKTILFAGVGIILIVIFMPRIYWSMVFKRVDHFVETTQIEYHDIEVNIDRDITVKEKSREIKIPFDEIVNFDYTKHNCILFYREKEKVNTLIIPVDVFEEEQLKQFHLKLMETRDGKTENH